jgi:hypothetical protein
MAMLRDPAAKGYKGADDIAEGQSSRPAPSTRGFKTVVAALEAKVKRN